MSNQDTAPFFGFIGAASALVFSCELISDNKALTVPNHSQFRPTLVMTVLVSCFAEGMGAAYGTAKSGAFENLQDSHSHPT